MAFADLELTREDIDSFEGQTFRDVNVTAGGSLLNLSEFDDSIHDKAKEELKTDILELTTEFLNDDSYASETALLDAIEAVDDENLLKNLLTYNFLRNWFFQDSTHRESFAFTKFQYYNQKYTNYLRANIKRLQGKLDPPKNTPRMKMVSTYR